MLAKPAGLLIASFAAFSAALGGCAAKPPSESSAPRATAEIPPPPRSAPPPFSNGGNATNDRRAGSLPDAQGEAPVPAPTCAAKCTGTASNELVNAVALRTRQVHRCYDRALAQDPALQGEMTVALTLAEDGSVCSSTVRSHTFPDDAVPTCVAQSMGAASYVPRGGVTGGCVEIHVPLRFRPQTP